MAGTAPLPDAPEDAGRRRRQRRLEIRWLHRPDADEGFVGAALSATMWHVRRDTDGRFSATMVIESPTRDLKGFPVPVPGPITDLVVSMDDRYLYFSHWPHGDLRGWMLKLDAGDDGLRVGPDFFVDFSPARAHEIHLPGGDPTTGSFS